MTLAEIRRTKRLCIRCGAKARKHRTTCERCAAKALAHTHRWRPLKKETSWRVWPEDLVTG